MSKDPVIPFEEEVRRFNEKVAELMRMYKIEHPTMSEAALRLMAEEMAEPYFVFSHQKSERPN